MSRTLIWFRNDIRIHDHEALYKASSEEDYILPVYIIGSSLKRGIPFFVGEISNFRKRFLVQSLIDLDNSLVKMKGNLVILEGNPLEIIPRIIKKYSIDKVYASAEYAPDELNEQTVLTDILSGLKVEFKLFNTGNLILPEDLPFPLQELPDIFTSFRKKVEAIRLVRDCFPTISNIRFIDHSERNLVFDSSESLGPFFGGESNGLKRLNHYTFESQHIKNYKHTRNGLLGLNYSSRLSPWLANGSLSVRKVFEITEKFENEVIENESTYWLKFELLWREYFRLIMMKYGKRLFAKGGLKPHKTKGRFNSSAFSQWKDGRTGQDFIDANMIELNQTGYMSNRGRQNVASYLVHDLGVDWRLGASYFETMLIDYDVYNNWGNWAYVAGVGNDPRENRRFNPEKQTEMYDPKNEFIEYWLSKRQGN